MTLLLKNTIHHFTTSRAYWPGRRSFGSSACTRFPSIKKKHLPILLQTMPGRFPQMACLRASGRTPRGDGPRTTDFGRLPGAQSQTLGLFE